LNLHAYSYIDEKVFTFTIIRIITFTYTFLPTLLMTFYRVGRHRQILVLIQDSIIMAWKYDYSSVGNR